MGQCASRPEGTLYFVLFCKISLLSRCHVHTHLEAHFYNKYGRIPLCILCGLRVIRNRGISREVAKSSKTCRVILYSEWTADHDLKLNVKKCKSALLLSRRHVLVCTHINDQTLESYKYLGVHISSYLS